MFVHKINGTVSTNTVNNLNQLTNTSFSYDLNGNLLADGQRTYKWDAENRLISMSYTAMPTRETQFRYNSIGQRVAIIEKNSTTPTETRYLWCDEKPCPARNVSDVVTKRYFAEGEMTVASNAKLYYSTNHLGSVRDVLSIPTGTKVCA